MEFEVGPIQFPKLSGLKTVSVYHSSAINFPGWSDSGLLGNSGFIEFGKYNDWLVEDFSRLWV